MLRENIEKVLREYQSAKNKPFSGHALAGLLRTDFPENLKSLVDDLTKYDFEGSAGITKWANCPWVAVFDIIVTDSAQSGYYPVYLFRQDMKGVYLSLNQGVTKVRRDYKKKAKDHLKKRASAFRAEVGYTPKRFQETSIDLAVTSSSEWAAFYEVGNIYARYYDSDELPSEGQLVSDFKEMLRLYELLSYEEEKAYIPKGEEDLRKYSQHSRIERRRKWSEAAKKIHGYTCQACGFNFVRVYGQLGEKFIEAHHLIPISQLKGKVVKRDPRHDFAVLCSNCHSMIHKFDKPEDIKAFKKILRQRKTS